jgi:hypothetical protein
VYVDLNKVGLSNAVYRSVFPEPLLIDGLHSPIVLLLRALPNDDRCYRFAV